MTHPVANPPLIPWADVPEGAVWFRPVGCDEAFVCGLKDSGRLFSPAIKLPLDLIEDGPFEFAAAEHQPGEHAAELAKLTGRLVAAEHHKALDRLGRSSYREAVEADLRTKLAESQVAQEQAEADLTRLRAGLAALEQEMESKLSMGIGVNRPLPQVTDDDLYRWIAALREGR